jgi:hypothetical protein
MYVEGAKFSGENIKEFFAGKKHQSFAKPHPTQWTTADALATGQGTFRTQPRWTKRLFSRMISAKGRGALV